MSRHWIVWWAMAAGLVCAPVAIATPVMTELAILTPSDAQPGGGGAFFGAAMAIEGDYAVIGAPGDGELAYNAGAVYIFRRVDGAWVEQVKLAASDATYSGQFGWSVDISGDRIVVGADHLDPVSPSFIGSAYVFRREGANWVEEAILAPPTLSPGDIFGRAVAIDGDTIVVGNPHGRGKEEGELYVFRRSGTTWLEEAVLTATGIGPTDGFGSALAFEGDTIVAGVGGKDAVAEGSGSVLVYHRVGGVWSDETEVLPAGLEAADHYGRGVALSGDTLLGGAPGDDTTDFNAGCVYVFRDNGGVWEEEAKVLTTDGDRLDNVGLAISLDNDVFVAGVLYDDDAGDVSGSAYIFRRNDATWIEVAKLHASDALLGQQFGYAVALNNDDVFVAASDSQVYVYRAPESLVVPTASAWGVVAMLLLILAAGTIIYGRGRPVSRHHGES